MKTKTKKIATLSPSKEEILIIKLSTKGCNGRPYVSITASTIKPIKKSDALEQVRQGLEDGELWKDAVANDRTELGLNQWVDMVMQEDGINGFDNSLYPVELYINDDDYIFESLSCGCLHDDILEVMPSLQPFVDLHLKDDATSIEKANNIINQLPNNDVDAQVKKYAGELIEEFYL